VASGRWTDLAAYRPLALDPGSVEARFLRWSWRAGGIHWDWVLAVLGTAFVLHYLGAERWTDRHGLPKEMIWLDIKWSLGIDTPRPPELVDIVTDRPGDVCDGLRPGAGRG
jgi:hypothetical protein